MALDLGLRPEDASTVERFYADALALRAAFTGATERTKADPPDAAALIASLDRVLELLTLSQDVLVARSIRRSRQAAMALQVMHEHEDALRELAR